MLTPEEMEIKRQALEEKRRIKRQKRRQKIALYLACSILGIVLLSASAYWTYFSRFSLFASVSSESPIVSILVLGSDSGIEGSPRTDTMMVFSIDRRTGSIGALSIPRDTRVQIPGRSGFDRINAAHAYGGPSLAVATIERLLDVPIDYYVVVDYDGFERIVDTLGGVVMDIPKPMYYVDEAQDLYIDLKPGEQRLTGRQALHFVRYRGDRLGDVSLVDPEEGGYVGRVDRQLQFVRALIKQTLRAQTVSKAPQLISDLRHAVVSDIPTDEAIRLALAVREFSTDKIQTAVLPGIGEMVGGASYWVVDAAKAREVVDRIVMQRDDMIVGYTGKARYGA